MKVTSKGQVTIPKKVREKLGIHPLSEVEFLEEQGRVFLVKKEPGQSKENRFAGIRGAATNRLSTEAIMRLTRGEK